MSVRHIYEQAFDEDVATAEWACDDCPECGGLVHTNSIETVCDDCGLIINDQPIDHGPEWVAFDQAERTARKRTGPALTPTRHDWGLSSEIGLDWTDANGTALSGRKRSQINRLRREHHRGRWATKADQNLAHGFSEVRRIVSILELSQSLRDQACRLYRTAAGEDLIRGRSIEAMAAASVFAVCRCTGLPQAFEEVGAAAAVAPTRVQNAFRVLNRDLSLPTIPVEPPEYVPKVASAVDASPVVQQRAAHLAGQVVRAGVSNGCNPAGIAAACVYQAAQERFEHVTQEALADAAAVTTSTVRRRWKELQTIVDEESDQPPGTRNGCAGR